MPGDAHQQHIRRGTKQMGGVAFQSQNLGLFSLPVGFEVGGDPAVVGRRHVRRAGGLGPLDDAVQRPFLEPHAGLGQHVAEPHPAHRFQRLGVADFQRQRHRRGVFPETPEAGGVAGQGRVQVLLDLAAENRRLLHEIPSVAGQQLQLPPRLVHRRLGQREPVDGGAGDGGQVGVVGLVARVGRLAELLGRETGGPCGPRTPRRRTPGPAGGGTGRSARPPPARRRCCGRPPPHAAPRPRRRNPARLCSTTTGGTSTLP